MLTKNETYSMFPYQIKDRELFYEFKKHPQNLHPNSIPYKKYWTKQLKRSVEGYWVNDNGTWVFMMPKLYFYINMSRIIDTDKKNKSRKKINPRLRDIEWIMFTYLLCCQGFSGFQDDDEYTCNTYVKQLEDGDLLSEYEKSYITDNCYNSKGKLKTYINAWEYLTKHYLVDHPAEKPLGRPLYDNQVYNFVILGARGLGKSFSIFCGDLLHEFLTAGVKFWEDIDSLMTRTLLFSAGGPDQAKLQKALNALKIAYENMPGDYLDKSTMKKKPSPFYRKLQGSWAVQGVPLKHSYKGGDGRDKGSMSTIEKIIFTRENPEAGVADRYVRIYCDEFGLVPNALDVHAANKNSLMVGDFKVGMAVYAGTSGNIDKVQQSKTLYMSPEAYDVFAIPNYWENPSQKIGLFIPAVYAYEEFKDAQGNTILELGYDHVMKTRAKLRDNSKDLADLEKEIMYRPLVPSEMFMVARSSLLPAQQARDQLVDLELYGTFEKIANWGDLEYVGDDVRFRPNKNVKPITDYPIDESRTNLRSAFVIYEQPVENPPKGLYKIVYDPVRDDVSGTSLASILVHKGIYLEDGESLENTIVAEWIGRYESVDEMHDLALKATLYYGGKLFPETNIPGVVKYLNDMGYGHLLQDYPHRTLSDAINEKSSKKNRVGYNMKSRDLKIQCEKWSKQWLLENRSYTDTEGNWHERIGMSYIYSPRLLKEISYYDREDNFDHLSSLFGLMLWLQEDRLKPIEENKSQDLDNDIRRYMAKKRKGVSSNKFYAY